MRVRDRLTSATATLMQRHGVAGTGIAEILATSGVTRRSIYLNFPGGKAELVAAATRARGDEMTTMVRDYVAQAGSGRGVHAHVERGIRQHGLRRRLPDRGGGSRSR